MSGNFTAGCGGAERQFFLFGRCLKTQGWKVLFITAKPSIKYSICTTELSSLWAGFSYLGGSKIRILPDWLSLWRAMIRANSDYYVIKVPGHLLAPMSLFCRIHNRRLVFWSQMSFDANPKERVGMNRIACMLQDWGLRRTDIVIAQTEAQKENFKENYGINAFVVPSICDSLTTLDKAIQIFDKKTDMLWVGNSLPKKQQEVIFSLAALLTHRTFAIAMNNSDTQRFEQARECAEKLSNIAFLGTVPPAKMELWFKNTRLFVNTSIREGFPNTFLQAWMNGVPVVSLNIDPDDIIKSNRLGYVISNTQKFMPYDNFKKLAQLMVEPIERLLNNIHLRKRIGKKSVEYICRNHVPDVVIPKLVNALHKNPCK